MQLSHITMSKQEQPSPDSRFGGAVIPRLEIMVDAGLALNLQKIVMQELSKGEQHHIM